MGRFLTPSILLAFALAGCRSNASQVQAQPASDPAAANLANASDTTAGAENPPPPPPDQGNTAPAPESAANEGYPNQAGYGDQYPSNDQAGYDETEYDVAPEPPPEIPDYDQPPCPGDDYIWAPGYWAYAPAGYYWVPGVWVLAPYVNALWTPGYWGFYEGRYHWYPGYWGPHVGFYGGVNYGFGYDGDGYEGGYWRNNSFYYNRAVTRVDENRVHRVYDYRVQREFNHSRVSYNGGNGGLHFRPSVAEQTAHNQRRFAALPSQRAHARDAMQNRAQFAKENHGRPQNFAQSQPINEGRSAPAPRAEDFHPAPSARSAGGHPAGRTGPATRPGIGTRQPNRSNEGRAGNGNHAPVEAPRPTPGNGMRPQPGRPVPQARPEPSPSHNESKPSPIRPEPGQGPQGRIESRPVPNPRQGQPSPRQEQRAQPRTQPPAPREQPRPQPEVRQAQPGPQPRQEQQRQQRPESRPQSQPPPHTEVRPQQSHPESRQAPRDQPHPQGKPGEEHPQ